MPTDPPTPILSGWGQTTGQVGCVHHPGVFYMSGTWVLIRPTSWLRGGHAIPMWGYGDVGPPARLRPAPFNSEPHQQ